MIVAKDWKLRTLRPENVAQLRPEALFNLKDKVAVVTGAGGGLGAWLSAGLGAAGANVFLTDHPSCSTQETADAIRKSGATVHEHQCDLMDSNAAIEFIGDRPGQVFRHTCDRSKFERLLGWTPRVSFEEGLAATVRWYRENEAWWRPQRWLRQIPIISTAGKRELH
jgi:nucleoside-diphosphate-sugar epimerase